MQPYLELGGIEIVSADRAIAYAARCGCVTLLEICECESTPGRPFTDPESDGAPWVHAEAADSASFQGVFVTDLELSAVPVRSVKSVSVRGAVGRMRPRHRVVTVSGLLVADAECGLEYGRRWLTDALAGGWRVEGCAADELRFLSCCPEDLSVMFEAEAVWQASEYEDDDTHWKDLSGNSHDAHINQGTANEPLFLRPDDGVQYAWFPGTADNHVAVTLDASTTYDYVVTYTDDTTASGSRTSDGGGVVTFGGTDVNFADAKVKSIDVQPNGGGATVAFADFTDSTKITSPLQATFTDDQSNQWTRNQSSTGRFLTYVTEPMWQFDGVDDYMLVAHHAALNFGTGPFSLVGVAEFASLTGIRRLVDKGILGPPNLVGYSIDHNESQAQTSIVNTASNIQTVTSPVGSLVVGQRYTLSGRRGDGQVTVGVDSGFTSAADAGINGDNTRALNIGRRPTGANFLRGLLFGLAVFRRRLTDAEVAQAGEELQA